MGIRLFVSGQSWQVRRVGHFAPFPHLELRNGKQGQKQQVKVNEDVEAAGDHIYNRDFVGTLWGICPAGNAKENGQKKRYCLKCRIVRDSEIDGPSHSWFRIEEIEEE